MAHNMLEKSNCMVTPAPNINQQSINMQFHCHLHNIFCHCRNKAAKCSKFCEVASKALSVLFLMYTDDHGEHKLPIYCCTAAANFAQVAEHFAFQYQINYAWH